ncbi:MAG TPA: hypothetical protein VJC39_05145 [Candidatus Nanoarchaeia archaeon]|nr:hypothetical protein [Candidatus Nanoarchaeia archaeon]
MELTITSKKVNQLLQRTEVEGKIVFKSETPSNKEVIEKIAKEFKVDNFLVVMRTIQTIFGQKTARFAALVYNSLKDKTGTEQLTSHQRKKLEEEKKKQAEEKKKAAQSDE